jgi:hypothetical protein
MTGFVQNERRVAQNEEELYRTKGFVQNEERERAREGKRRRRRRHPTFAAFMDFLSS